MEITNIEKFAQAVKFFQNILIFLGENYSFDELAAALALGISLEKAGKKIVIFSPKLPLVEEASLFGIAKITNKLNSGKLVISIPGALESVDKVTHYLEGDALNIVVHPIDSGAKLEPERVKISKTDNLADFIILINTPGVDFLNTLNTQEQIICTETQKFLIGKAINGIKDETLVTGSGNVCLSETMVWILDKLGLLQDSDSAANLFQGMSVATSFQPPKAVSSTFAAASICLKQNPTLPQVQKEVAKPQEATVPKTGNWKNLQNISNDYPETLLKSDILNTAQDQNIPDKNQELGPSPEDDSKIPSDWVGPKILKSSGNLKKS